MSLISRPIISLAARTIQSSEAFRRSGVLYDYAVAGVGLLAATSDRFPYGRETADFRKQQFDNSDNPGEQSLTGWWMRAQSSWHHGAGTKFMEPASDDEVMTSFRESVGVDPWIPGELKLLKATAQKRSSASDVLVLGAVDGSTDIFLHADGANLYRETAAGTAAVTWGGVNPILALAEDGTNYYAADSVGIYKGTLAGGAGSKIWDTGDASVVIGWAKQRLVAGIGNSVYELVGGTPPTLPTALYSHPNTSWTWTSIAEGPQAIYAAGYAGAQSAIYKFTLDSSGAMPTLTSGVIAASLPTGEVVHSIYSYVGAFMAIGTSKGVRIGVIGESGDISYGPLIIESDSPVNGFVGKDRFLFATCTDQIDGDSGLWRIDLGTQKQDGRFAYATDLNAGVTGEVNSVSLLGASGRLVFGVSGQGSYLESDTDLVPSGTLTTGYIRFNTVEPKRFQFVTGRVAGPGTVGIEALGQDEVATSVVTITAASDEQDYALNRAAAETVMALRFTLTRESATAGPTLASWQIKAQPAIVRQRLIRVPVLLFENMRDSKGTLLPPVDVHAVLSSLETLENDASPVAFAELCHNPSRTELVVIDKIEYQQVDPPANCKGDGGIAYLTLRTIQ